MLWIKGIGFMDGNHATTYPIIIIAQSELILDQCKVSFPHLYSVLTFAFVVQSTDLRICGQLHKWFLALESSYLHFVCASVDDNPCQVLSENTYRLIK
jgi:hypothetical protein